MRGLSCFTVMALVSCCACADVPDCGIGSPTHIPHPTDCTKYYTCTNGQAILQYCAPGLWWDVAIEGCDLPEHSICAAASSTSPKPTTTPTMDTSSPTPTTTVAIKTTTPVLCGDDSPTHIPHPTKCSMYYTCVNGQAILQNCPTGLWWDVELEGCNLPQYVDCPAGSSTTANTVGTTGGESTLPTEGSTGGESTTDGNTDLPDCHGTSDTLLPHPTDCTMFYKCLEGVPYPLSCPPGLWWHQEILVCDWPLESECTPGATRPPTEPNTTPAGSTTAGPPTEPPAGLPNSCPTEDVEGEVIRLPHENCRFYYRCGNGGVTLFACPSEEHFSPTKRVCRDRRVAGCDSCPPVDEEGEEVRLPHETDCHRYYLCNKGERELFQCRNDWHLSRAARECMEPELAKCAS